NLTPLYEFVFNPIQGQIRYEHYFFDTNSAWNQQSNVNPGWQLAGPIACVYSSSLPNTVAVYRVESSPSTNVPVDWVWRLSFSDWLAWYQPTRP
ncbi:MAG: hypothetical protein J2P57_09840, partial [Acidimicrobiaceae bacterium]|nr:hypothetical protein [Acidimicrobiaceae bacterium]